MVPAEVELHAIALQVLLAYVVERAIEAALEDRKAALNRVRGHVAARRLGAFNRCTSTLSPSTSSSSARRAGAILEAAAMN